MGHNRASQESLIKKIRAVRRSYTAVIHGRTFIIHPDVFSPALVLDTRFFLEHLPSQRNKTMLEIGTGTGIMSITAALKGAKHVTAVDINRKAVRNTEENARLHKVDSRMSIFVSDIYKSVSKHSKFDTILWNIPWGNYGGKRLNLVQRAFYDPKFSLLRRFIVGASKHLKPHGRVLIGYSTSVGDKATLEEAARRAGFKTRIVAQTTFKTGHPGGPLHVELFELSH